MNISPAERAAEFEGPASQPPLGTRQFATKSLDWTIPVQRMDILSRVTRNRVSPCDSTVKTRPSLVSPLFPPPPCFGCKSRGDLVPPTRVPNNLARRNFFSMLEKFSSKSSSTEREKEREISLDGRGFENNPRDETK